MVVAIYTPMELISTTTLAFLFLGEEPGLRQLAGAACILAGLLGEDFCVSSCCGVSGLPTNISSSNHIRTANREENKLGVNRRH